MKHFLMMLAGRFFAGALCAILLLALWGAFLSETEGPSTRGQAFVERRLDVHLDEPQWVYRAPWRGPPRARLDCRCEEVRP